MGVDLLLILFLQAKDHLDRCRSPRFQMHRLSLQLHANLSGVLVNVGGHVLAADLLLRNTLLEDPKTGEHCPGPRVDLGSTIADDTYDDFLPSFFAPGLAVCPRAHVLYVFENPNHCSREEKIVFVVHGNNDEKLGIAGLCEQPLSQSESCIIELRRVASSCGISHVGELVSFRWLSMRYLTQEFGWNRAVEHKIAIKQLDFLHRLPSSNGSRTGRWMGRLTLHIRC